MSFLSLCLKNDENKELILIGLGRNLRFLLSNADFYTEVAVHGTDLNRR